MNIFTKLVSLLKSETEMVPNPTDNSARVKYGGLHVSKELDKFLRDEVVTGINIQPSLFWKSLESILDTFGPKNIELLAKRAIFIIDRVVIEEMKGGVDLEKNFWYIPKTI